MYTLVSGDSGITYIVNTKDLQRALELSDKSFLSLDESREFLNITLRVMPSNEDGNVRHIPITFDDFGLPYSEQARWKSL